MVAECVFLSLTRTFRVQCEASATRPRTETHLFPFFLTSSPHYWGEREEMQNSLVQLYLQEILCYAVGVTPRPRRVALESLNALLKSHAKARLHLL
jgi:hypothetical protein